MKEIKVIQDEIKPVPVEVLAEAIKSISEGIKKLRNGVLKDDALILLIQHASPTIKSSGYKANARPTPKQIRAVLEGMEHLEKTYLRNQKS